MPAITEDELLRRKQSELFIHTQDGLKMAARVLGVEFTSDKSLHLEGSIIQTVNLLQQLNLENVHFEDPRGESVGLKETKALLSANGVVTPKEMRAIMTMEDIAFGNIGIVVRNLHAPSCIGELGERALSDIVVDLGVLDPDIFQNLNPGAYTESNEWISYSPILYLTQRGNLITSKGGVTQYLNPQGKVEKLGSNDIRFVISSFQK